PAFVNGASLAELVDGFHAIAHVTKDDVLAAARRYLGRDNYAAIYKRQGEDTTVVKMPKPDLTPIAMNRDASSAFLTEIQNSKVDPIEPVFVDFDRDLTRLTAKQGTEVLYTHNPTNDVFSLTYIYDKGTGHDLDLEWASDVLSLSSTADMTPEQISRAFYDLACSYRVVTGPRRTYVVISGLSENMPAAMTLYEKLLSEATISDEAWQSLLDRSEQSRANSKTNQSANFSRLTSYAMYGEHNPGNNVSNIDSLRTADPAGALDAARSLRDLKHTIIYYGNKPAEEVTAAIDRLHAMSAELKDAPAGEPYTLQPTPETVIYLAPYDSKQLYMRQVSNRGEQYDPASEPALTLYNEYFGGSMNSIVFQEMRESRSLAYSAGAIMQRPSRLGQPYIYTTFIATQNDKMCDAIAAFDEIINNMPRSQAALELAKQGIDSRLRTERTIKDNIAWAYINVRELGRTDDGSRVMFETIPTLTMADLEKYQQEHVAGRTYTFAILADLNDIDIDALHKIGKVVILTPEQTFGY
ncbi:MAG: insulinase family protein, partial [Muribaculaceae bacterium]|nr:insulinase family protein [Muribaculaceae bacterium]